LKEHTTKRPDRHDPNAQDNTKHQKNYYFHKFTTNLTYGKVVAEKLSLGRVYLELVFLDLRSMRDLYDRMGRMEIRHDAIKQMEYRQSYHWDRYHGVFEHIAGVYSVLMQGAYNPPGYAQPQYDKYYQQYPPPPPPQQQQDDDE
ncbi:hypothetical protein Tco_1374769, partial [Tanacetum coccineum]